MSKKGSYFYTRLCNHLGVDPGKLAVIETSFSRYERANLHLAIEELLRQPGVSHQLRGIILRQEYENVSLAKLSRRESARAFLRGPVEYEDVDIAADQRLSCVKRGLFQVTTPDGPMAMLIRSTVHEYPPRLKVQVMAQKRLIAEDFSRRLSTTVARGAAFRGQILSLEMDCHRELEVRYHRLPTIQREELILPEAVIRRLERQAMGFVQHAAALKSAGRHLKRGILLHGPPGTGKTLSAMYIASQMPGRSVLMLTGGGISAIEATGRLARSLEPATIILEDVDLIGTEREHQSVSANALLFELLNQMDGLAEDADVLFVLTTNRPDIIEPALISRPGRIDQAIEIPLPDADCRRRLLALYSHGLAVELRDAEKVISLTSGVSAAFIRELLRKAALFAAESNGDGAVMIRDEHVATALAELTTAGGLTSRLLGTVDTLRGD